MEITETRTAYGFGTKLNIPYEEAIERVKAALKEEGFGVLTEIDVKKTIKEKLGKDFRKYIILGACNPVLAHQAFEAELEIGLMLPCNVVVHEDNGGSKVMVMDPRAAIGIVKNEGLSRIADEATSRLERVVASLERSQRK